MKSNTKEKGITLIALIVTIIVLLILAGVTIISLTGENGILGKSSDAKLKREIAKEIEQIKLSVNAVYTSYYDKGYLPVVPLRKELQTSYEGVESVEETSDIGEATKVSKVEKKVDLGSMFWTESLAAENEDTEPTQEFAKVTYTSKREYYVKIKNVTGGNSDPVGTIYEDGDKGSSSQTYKIQYVANGGAIPENAVTEFTSGEKVIFPTSNEVNKEGNVFEGWYLSSDFSGESVQRTDSNMTSDITLYAKWTEETNPDYFEWSTTSTGATIKGFSDLGNEKYNNGELTDLIIPKKYNGLPVISINEYAFSDRTLLKKILLPESYNVLKDGVFKNCTEVEEITLPISLNVGNNTYGTRPALFANCTNVKKVNFTKGTGIGVNYITGNGSINCEYYAATPWYYSRDNEITVTIEEGVTSIGKSTFRECTGLKKLDIPSSVTKIGEYAFYLCENWEAKVDISNITSIGEHTFDSCSGVDMDINLNDNLELLGAYAFKGCSKIRGTVRIPNKITKLNEYVFEGCEKIKKVVLLDTIQNISDGTFKDCTEIEEITLPISLNVGNNTYGTRPALFANCTNVKKVNFTKGTGIGVNYITGNGSINCEYYAATPWYYSRDNEITVTIEEGVTSIGTSTFRECTGLKKLDIPSSVTQIGGYAFYLCENWEAKVDISNVTSIGEHAFESCSGVDMDINLNDDLEVLGESAFKGCSKIRGTVKISNKITKLNGYVFEGCERINKVIIPDTVQSTAYGTFKDCIEIEEITLPISLNVGNNTYGVWPAVFANCTKVKKVNFTKGTGVGVDYGTGNGAYNCAYCAATPWYYSRENQIIVTMEEGITTIGTNTFRECSGLISIELPSTLEKVKNSAFYKSGTKGGYINKIYRGNNWDSIVIGDDNEALTSGVYEKELN